MKQKRQRLRLVPLKITIFLFHFAVSLSIKRTEETGVLIRSPIGLLLWMGNEAKTAAYNLGSRYKTPVVPIWVVVASDLSGVLFGEDKGLLRDHQAENRFGL